MDGVNAIHFRNVSSGNSSGLDTMATRIHQSDTYNSFQHGLSRVNKNILMPPPTFNSSNIQDKSVVSLPLHPCNHGVDPCHPRFTAQFPPESVTNISNDTGVHTLNTNNSNFSILSEFDIPQPGSNFHELNIHITLPDNNIWTKFRFNSSSVGKFLLDSCAISSIPNNASMEVVFDGNPPSIYRSPSPNVHGSSHINPLNLTTNRLVVSSVSTKPDLQKPSIHNTTFPLPKINLATEATRHGLPLRHPLNISIIPNAFENLSGVYVPSDVATILSFGPRFIPPSRPNFGDYVDQLYQIEHNCNNEYVDPSLHLRGFLMASYDSLLECYSKAISPTNYRLMQMLSNTKKFLSGNPTLCLVQSDKGKSTVLMKVDDYKAKMENWISKCESNNVYKVIDDLSEIRRARARWYRSYHVLVKKLIKYYDNLFSTTKSRPFPMQYYVMLKKFDRINLPFPHLYGLVKTHKIGSPCRPICNTRGWYGYVLQKIINHTLSTAVKHLLSPNNVSDINVAASQIRGIVPFDGYAFIKFDIVDMYTNMRRDKIIDIIKHIVSNQWYIQNSSLLSPGLLTDCLQLCLGEFTYFTYENRTFIQLRGLPQGACDSGLLATIQLDYIIQLYEESIISSNGVVHWWKYMDDILMYAPVNNHHNIKFALERHTGLELTVEAEQPVEDVEGKSNILGEISFLDLQIIRCKNQILMRSYRKPMASSRMCHFLTNCTDAWKEGAITGYIMRVLFRVSNDYLRDDLAYIEELFRINMYPSSFTDPILLNQLTAAIRTFEITLRNVPFNFHHPHHSLGDLKQRIRIIKDQLQLYNYIDGPVVITPTKITSNYRFPPTGSKYYPSQKYIVEEFRTTLQRIYRELGLGRPTYRNGDSLFAKLKMSLATADPNIHSPNNSTRIFILECDNCPSVFLFSGTVPASNILHILKNDSQSIISTHIRITGHTIPFDKLPYEFHTTRYPNVPPGQWITLLKMLYNTLGYDSITTENLSLLTKFIQRGVTRALHTLSPYIPIADNRRVW